MRFRILFIILLPILIHCSEKVKTLKAYGYVKHDFERFNGFIGSPLAIDTFDDYGALVNELYERSCDEQPPYFEIENDNYIGGVYPILICNPPPWHPLERNTFYITELGVYKNYDLVSSDSLETLIIKNYMNHGKLQDFADNPNKVLFIFEFPEETQLDRIKNKIRLITNIYDKVENVNGLGIILGLERNLIPPLPDTLINIQ